jgi:ATP-dependent DNA helicase RecG
VYSSQILNTAIEYLKGVGPLKGDLLRKELGIATFGDLLLHFPFRYIDKSKVVKVAHMANYGEAAMCIAKVAQIDTIGEGFKKRLVIVAKDDSAEIELVWFKGIAWVTQHINLGDYITIYGKATYFNNTLQISHPEVEKYDAASFKQQTLEPVYSTTEKLKAKGVNSKAIYRFMQTLLPQLTPSDVPEFLPDELLLSQRLMSRYDAITNIHLAYNNQAQQAALHRLKFEELFVQQMQICTLKLQHTKRQGIPFLKVGEYFNTFYKSHLPFALTEDQKKVIKEIHGDLGSGYQMNRLLQGDVGSGKTIVALLCMLIALDNNAQACLIAPTEILAQQHFAGLSELLKDMPVQIAIFTGNIKGKQRKETLAAIASGHIQIAIGTHALFEDTVQFQNLGLAIIDEQHRFGVAQRASMWKKNTIAPHILVMTATPIPRTLAMTSYGDLDVSTIEHLPPGRKPIKTIHRMDIQRVKVMEFAKAEVAKGRQIYIVYPLIAESEKLDYENLEAGYEQVKIFFPLHSYNTVMVHGKQTLQEREGNMRAFVEGRAQVMVATTVIEVGVNVPNASVMIIESAERFGLSQLHQLRGRVGRGAEESFCILLTGNKLSNDGKVRINTMVNEINGFRISEVDLELRGPGEIHGTRQSGAANLKLADLVQDVALVAEARKEALHILTHDAQLMHKNNALLKLHLSRVGNRGVWSKIS